ncbi:MAG: M20/M25/M40 family metallo-hydrolase [Actinomycetota bacterium]|nr:M20/M25/M40 family metallo-hydrolase [Actinomycetota bacterium]
MAIPETLDALLRAHGPSGHEQLAYDAVREAVGDVAEIESDSVGNLVARRQGDGPLLALFAHLDVIGLAVAHIPDDALVPVHQLGGMRASVAYGQRVEIRTKRGAVPGVVARKAKDNEKVEWSQLYVDIGAADGEEARSLVSPGDPMVIVGEPLELAGSRVASRSLDNRASVYVALEAFRRLESANVAVVASAQEELGHHGARTAAYRLRPDVAIALDVTYATDVPADDPNTGGHHRLGGGAAIFRGPLVNPRVFELLVEAAEAEGIEHTVETGMDSHTDADDTYVSREGIPTGLVSIPLRNMHSPIEIVDLEDLEACVRLLVAFAQKLEPDASYAR